MADTPTDPKQCVFALMPLDDGTPLLIIGIPEAGWGHLREGKTSDFDMTKLGLPFAVSIFGGKDQAECLAALQALAAKANADISKDLMTDFGFDKPRKH